MVAPASSTLVPHPSGDAVLLAFDTSTERMAVAVCSAAGRWHVHAPGGAAASAGLLPSIHRLLDGCGLKLGDVAAIGFGRGPGAFTGLRTSCAVAQGLAFGLGCGVLPIDSLLIVAEDARLQAPAHDRAFEVGVAMDARMGEVYAARYRWQDGHWRTLEPPALGAATALAAQWRSEGPTWLAGSALTAFGPTFDSLGGRRLPEEQDRAAALLRLTEAAHAAGAAVAPEAAWPVYLRDKVALTTREREALRAETAL